MQLSTLKQPTANVPAYGGEGWGEGEGWGGEGWVKGEMRRKAPNTAHNECNKKYYNDYEVPVFSFITERLWFPPYY